MSLEDTLRKAAELHLQMKRVQADPEASKRLREMAVEKNALMQHFERRLKQKKR